MEQFELYKDTKGEYRWRLQAKNNKIIADSGEGYTRKANCEGGIRLAKRLADGQKAPVNDRSATNSRAGQGPEFEIYQTSDGDYAWRLQAENNKVIADSAEDYERKRECEKAVKRFCRIAPDAPINDKTSGGYSKRKKRSDVGGGRFA